MVPPPRKLPGAARLRALGVSARRRWHAPGRSRRALICDGRPMTRALPLVAVCLSVLALAAAVMPRGEPAPPPVVAPAPAAPDEELEYLKRRVELLEDDQRALWDRLVALERRPAGASDGGGAEVQAEVARLREELRSVMTGEVLSSEAGRSALKDVLREAEEDRARDRFLEREQRRTAQVEAQREKWKAFVGTAKLTWEQEQKLNERLATEERERQRLLEQLRLGAETWQDVGRYLRDQRRETDQVMRGVLDETQQAQYRELRRDDGGGRDVRRREGENPRGGTRRTP